MKFEEIEGNLIDFALEGKFDVIAHGCNCFCTQKKGLAKIMVEAFATNEFDMEQSHFKGDINRLGTIDFKDIPIEVCKGDPNLENNVTEFRLTVVNAYTQYRWANMSDTHPLDYEALALCMRKINKFFFGRHIGLPRIGCGLAGGDWLRVEMILRDELKDCNVTIVNHNHDKL